MGGPFYSHSLQASKGRPGVALDGNLGTAQGNTVRRCGSGVRVVAGFGNRVEANSCEGCLGPDLVDDGRATTLGSVRAP